MVFIWENSGNQPAMAAVPAAPTVSIARPIGTLITSNANKIGKARIPIVNRSTLLTGPWGLKTMGYEAVYGAGC